MTPPERLQDVTLAERLRETARLQGWTGDPPKHSLAALLEEAAAALSVHGDVIGYMAAHSLRAIHACRDDVHNGYAEVWMRPRQDSDVPVYATPPAPDATNQEPQ